MFAYIQSLSPCVKIFAVAGGILFFSLIVSVVYRFFHSIVDKLSIKMFPPFLLLLLMGCSFPEKSPCNTMEVYEEMASEFEEIAKLKRMCGHLVGGSEYRACRLIPYVGSEGMDCDSLKGQEEELKAFLGRHRQPLCEACAQDENCQSWWSRYKSSVKQTVSPTLFPAVELLQEASSTPGVQP